MLDECVCEVSRIEGMREVCLCVCLVWETGPNQIRYSPVYLLTRDSAQIYRER